ncbi:MAG: hypothetical protein D6714_19620 [Bacteroidetes bacterium]|nr:MAG: hypothetical protein D6714_19620 [Bacteroidota bacterium]
MPGNLAKARAPIFQRNEAPGAAPPAVIEDAARKGTRKLFFPNKKNIPRAHALFFCDGLTPENG